MRINELFYWLQGFFEISSTTEALTSAQCGLILRHIDLVNVGEGRSADAARLGKMRTLLNLAVDGDLSPVIATDKLRAEISAQFIHVIDPAEGGPAMQEHLNATHSGRPTGNLVARC